MGIEEIKNMPQVITAIELGVNGAHESVMRSYHILNHVLLMVERGDSKETIKEVAEYLMKKSKF